MDLRPNLAPHIWLPDVGTSEPDDLEMKKMVLYRMDR